MKTNSKQCQTLGEYRTNVLRKSQAEVAKDAKCQQGWITQVERGHLPKPWNRSILLSAYRLAESEFERLVTTAAKLKAIKKPMREDLPLLSMAEQDLVAEVVRLAQLRIREEGVRTA